MGSPQSGSLAAPYGKHHLSRLQSPHSFQARTRSAGFLHPGDGSKEIRSRVEVMALFLTTHGLTLGWHQPLNRGSESQGSADVCMVGAEPHALCPLPNLGQGTSLASVLSSAPSLWPAVRDAHRELGACWCAHGVSFHSPPVEQHHDHGPQRGSKNMPLVRTLTPKSL